MHKNHIPDVHVYYSYIHWHGDHSGGATPGLVSIPEVKSSSDLECTVGESLWEIHDVAGHYIYKIEVIFLTLSIFE